MYSAVYGRLPRDLQSALLSARGLLRMAGRAGGGAAAHHRELARCEAMSPPELRTWQAARLTAVLDHAAQHVPYYADMPRHRLSDGGDIFVRLREWPVLDKHHVKQYEKLLLASDVHVRMPAYTSGTTGSPMRTWRTPRSIAYEQALLERQLRWAGWRRGQRRVWLRGDVVVPLSETRPPFWRHNVVEQMLMCSSFHLSETNAPRYIEAIETYDPVVIQAYPSSIAYLARWMADRGRHYRGKSLRGIVTSSERLTNAMRLVCSEAFGASLFDWYGQSERVAAIGTCEYGRYHLIEDGGYAELLPQPDGTAAIIATAFENRAMPLIRYRTGDCVLPAPAGERCRCGRAFRLIEAIFGREADAIVTSNGREHVMLDFIFDHVIGLQEAQIVQEEIDVVDILMVLRPGTSLRDVEIVRSRALERLGPGVQVRLHAVPSITRTAAGKFELIVNRIADPRPAGVRAEQ